MAEVKDRDRILRATRSKKKLIYKYLTDFKLVSYELA